MYKAANKIGDAFSEFVGSSKYPIDGKLIHLYITVSNISIFFFPFCFLNIRCYFFVQKLTILFLFQVKRLLQLLLKTKWLTLGHMSKYLSIETFSQTFSNHPPNNLIRDPTLYYDYSMHQMHATFKPHPFIYSNIF